MPRGGCSNPHGAQECRFDVSILSLTSIHLNETLCFRLWNLNTTFQAQMVRRVKAYLKSMKVITNEEELHKMSMECEPPLGGLPPPPPVNTVSICDICL